MDLRRGNRAVIGPKVRQVGFVTPDAAASSSAAGGSGGAAAPARSQSVPNDGISSSSPPSSDLSLAGSSLSPVMIPPPRHASADASLSIPHHHVGSYNPSEAILGSPPAMSPSRSSRFDPAGSEFSEEEEIRMEIGRIGSMPKSNLGAPPSVPKTVNPVSESSKRDSIDTKNEGVGPSIPFKQKTSKAERRALQEAQRAAKAAAKEAAGSSAVSTSSKQAKATPKPGPQKKDTTPPVTAPVVSHTDKKVTKKEVLHPRMQFDDIPRVEKAKRRAVVNQSEARNRVELFRHLPQYMHGTLFPDLEAKFFQLEPMHPSVYKVGLQYLSGAITSSNARCIAMLLAFREAINDYSTPPEKTLTRDLTAKISTYVSFLIECRPLSISMGNAIRWLKTRITNLAHHLSDREAKSSLQSDIDQYINEKIIVADKAIVSYAVTKIRDGDVLLTYGSDSVVEAVLLRAHEIGKNFRVVVVDSRPDLEGHKLLRNLVERGICCTYTHVNAVSYMMHEVTRVFLGASGVLCNGTVYSGVGTACVAMVAHAYRVPVLVCCEAYKFHERVQLDSICSNELGDPDEIAKVPGRKDLDRLNNWAENENLQLLNLKYDITPSDYVSVIITEHGMIPPTSVPVIVREYGTERLWT